MRNTVLGLPSLSQRRRKFDLITVYKVLYGHYGLNSNIFFKLRAYNTRENPVQLAIPRSKRNVMFHYFVNIAGTKFEKLLRLGIGTG